MRDNSSSFYKEIFFASAKNSKLSHVRDLIFARSSVPTTTSDKTRQMETLLADKISTLNPDFYSVFNAKMQSGDHVLIEEGLREGGKMLKQALYATPELAKGDVIG